MNLNLWLDLLPAGLGLFVIVVAAGILGLFRSMALSKQSYTDTVESLQRQVDILMQENAILKSHIVMLDLRLEQLLRDKN
jgi:phage shock protein A